MFYTFTNEWTLSVDEIVGPDSPCTNNATDIDRQTHLPFMTYATTKVFNRMLMSTG